MTSPDVNAPGPTTVAALPPDFLPALGHGIAAIVLYAAVGLLLMFVGFYALDLTTPGTLTALVRTGKPNAAVVTGSALLSMALIVVVAIIRAGGNLTDGVLDALIFGLIGVIVLALVMRALEWALRLDIGAVLAAEEFRPACIAVAAAYLGLGLVVAAAIF